MQKSKRLLSALMALVMVLTAFPIMTFATANGNKERPASDTTAAQPFVIGNPSQNYRIPNIITLNDGTLIAAADARWNKAYDGGGNDVIVTRSTDNGNSWRYSLLNYFGDNGDAWNKSSTSFCDSALATDGQKVYVLSTFFPAGYALNSSSANNRPVAENAFDNAGRLKLRLNSGSTWDYYLDFNTKNRYGNYVIRRYSNNSITEDYFVDTEFFLHDSSNGKNGSIFYSDGAYQTVKTTFLWFRSSDDGGITWNAPRLVNVKLDSEMFMGVGPGRGVVTSTGDIVFATYRWNRQTTLGIEDNNKQVNWQRTYLISSSDGGYTWNRTSGNATNDAYWSSESAPVELPNGDIRVFLRAANSNLQASDARRNADGTYSWLNNCAEVNAPGLKNNRIDCYNDCQKSAIMYPYKIDGKNAILVSTPINYQKRANGCIHLLLLDDDNNVVNTIRYAVNGLDEYYDYSCMTVMQDGDIGLLCEDVSGGITFRKISIAAIASGLKIDKPEKYTIKLQPGETYSVSISDPSLNITNSSSSIADITTKEVVEAKCRPGISEDKTYSSGETYPLSNALYTLQSQGGNLVFANARTSAGNQYLNFGVRWGNPNYGSEGGTVEVTTASGLGAPYVNIKTSSSTYGTYYLTFGKGTGGDCENMFDRHTNASDTTRYVHLGCTYQQGAAMLLYRPVRLGETSSTEIPGYVRLSSVSEVTQGEAYLIVAQNNAGDYFVLYPSSNQADNNTARRSHVAKLVSSETVVMSNEMKISAKEEGTTKIMVGDNIEYDVIVTQMDSVTGAVKYDPVIYIQGNAITETGNQIAASTNDGEYKTGYKLADGWSIDSVQVATPEIINPQDSTSTVTSANVTASNGLLTGTVNVSHADGKTDLDDWIKVLVTTYLIGPDGKTYIQKDHLYVTGSPVPAHGVAISQSYRSAVGGNTYIILAPLVVIAKGSTSSYNASEASFDQSKNSRAGYVYDRMYAGAGNALNMFTRDGMYTTRDSFSHVYTSTGNKIGGSVKVVVAGRTLSPPGTTMAIIRSATRGHYYYDKSSTQNPGFTSSNGNNFTLDYVLNRPYISSDDRCPAGGRIDFNEFSYTLNGAKTTYATDGTGQFKQFDFTQGGSNALQKLTVSGNVSGVTNGTIDGQLYGKLSHQYDSEDFWAVSEVTVPFTIHVQDKSSVRTAYNNAMTNNGTQEFDVLISSDYTTDTWNEYQTSYLNAEGWLNNYDYNQPTLTGNNGNMLATNYANLTRVCDFTELDEILRAKKSLYESEFPFGSSGYNIYTKTSWRDFQNYYSYADNFANVLHAVVNPTSTPRPNLPGYTPGAHSTTKNANQETIDTSVERLTNYPVYAADPTNFEAAKALSKTLDLDAYNLVEPIRTEIASGDAEIYFEGKPENKIVDIPASDQKTIDDHTAALLNTMNVATDGNTDPDNNKGKVCNVTVRKYNKTTDSNDLVYSNCYAYNTQLLIDLTPYIDDSETATIVITNDNSTTTIPLTDDKVIPVLAASGNVDITITTTQKPAVVVYDYYGTILYSGFVNAKSDIVCDDAAKTVTIGGTVVDAKPSPSIKFDHWLIVTEDDGTYKVLQRGIRVGSDYSIVVAKGTNADGNEVAIGTVTHFGETEPTETFSGLNRQYTVKAADTITPLVWKMSVSNENQTAREYLAAYGSTFSRFTSNYDVIYTPLTDEDQVTAFGDAYGKPISYGDGYISGDNKDKFTLSCSYSQAPDTIIREAGVLYSTNGDLNAETMLKGAEGVAAKKQTKVSEDGTYTMTKKDIGSDTHLMRSYVTYTTKELGATIICVSYGPVYKCVDGQVSIVD